MQTNAAFNLDGKTVLITGGTGSFGRKFVETALKEMRLKKLIVFSRDELKQHEMREAGLDAGTLRYFVGDVRDRQRLSRAMDGIDVVIHASALKQVPACEYNPIEAILTNIMGARNVVDAAIDAGVQRVVALSTDKAVNPVNLYGATKLCAEKLLVQANAYVGGRHTSFCCVRYGNVIGSRGSVVDVLKKQAPTGEVTLTDPRMTRFWLTMDQGVKFVINSVGRSQGGEIFVPKIPSMRVTDLMEALTPNCKIKQVGIRPGEKLHECLLSEDEARHTLEFDDHFLVKPTHAFWSGTNPTSGKPVAESFSYRSDNNSHWLKGADLLRLIQQDARPIQRAA